MHFDYLPEHEMLRDATRGYLEHADPIARIRRGLDAKARRTAWRTDAAQSWAGLLAPEEYGGAGASIVEAMVVGEELGRAAHPGPFIASNTAAAVIARFASPEIRAEILPRLIEGAEHVALAVSGFEAPSVRAVEADGGWRLEGQARFVQDGDIATLVLIAAETARGRAFFLLPADAISARRAHTYDLSRTWSDLTFTANATPGHRIGADSDADAIATLVLRTAATLAAIDSVGIAARLLDMTVQYTKERQAFGKPIAAFQAIKHRCADMLIQLESARVAVWYAAVAVRDDMDDADEAVSIAKFFASEAAAYIAGQALQLHGGIGFTWEHDLHILLKRAKANEAVWGTASSHRERVARGLDL